jgi:hypothetical protein
VTVFILSFKDNGQKFFVNTNLGRMTEKSRATTFASKFSALQYAKQCNLQDIEIYPVEEAQITPLSEANKDIVTFEPPKETKTKKGNTNMEKDIFITLQEQLTKALNRINDCKSEDIEQEIKRAHGVAEIANAMIQGANAQANCVKVAESLKHASMPTLLGVKNG